MSSSENKVGISNKAFAEENHENGRGSAMENIEMNDVTFSDKNGKKPKSKEKGVTIPSVPYTKLFRYANGVDCLLMVVGTIAGMAHGAGFPGLFILFGQLTTTFTNYGRYKLCELDYNKCFARNLTTLNETQWNIDIQPSLDTFEPSTVAFCAYIVYIACGVFVLGSVQTTTWSLQSVRQTKRIRIAYFKSILRQDMGFHDVTSAGELNVRLSSDMNKVKDGIGEKFATNVQYLSTFVACIITGFFYSWRVALVTVAVAPVLGLASFLTLMVADIFTKKELAAYSKAGSIAEEAIAAIRTIVAFGCQHKEVDRYFNHLGDARKVGIKRGFMTGVSNGLMHLAIFGMYGLSFWYGSTLVIDGTITIGALTTTFFNIAIAAFSLGLSGTNFSAFSAARAAGAKIFEVIDRVPDIDIFSEEGIEPNTTSGEMSLNDVHFTYPSRPDVEILKGVSLKIEHGKTVALVGQSGCGKSTIIQLIQRFYDVNSGNITIGGNDVKSLKLRKHRELIGLVAQEPVLFATTIAENIRWGREGITEKEIKEAAKQANAYDFIMKLPKKFETLVGEGGGQMSGGQKQRIAIARAIARNPKILLLDEATSALDTESESIVQAALDKASEGRTTVVIAHRLSTIRNADKIVAFHEGRIMEQGTHEELLNINDGVYANLIRMQAGREGDDEQKDLAIIEENETSEIDVVFHPKQFKAKERAFSSSSFSRLSGNKRILSTNSSIRSRTMGEDQEEEEEEKEDLPDIPFSRVLGMNKKEWPYIAVGCLFAAVAGSPEPVGAIVFAEVLKTFTLTDSEEQLSKATLNGLLYFAIGVAAFFSYTFMTSLFGKSGAELTIRLRKQAFQSILRQDISYFDDHKNSTGALCTRLATDASRVQGSTGIRLGTIIKNFSSLGVAIGISFAYGWQLTLLALAFIPLIALGGFLEVRFITGNEVGEAKAYEGAGQIAGEAIKNIRTIASLTKEHNILKLYVEKLTGPVKKAVQKSLVIGVGYGYSQCVIFFAYAAVFRLGIHLVVNGDMRFEDVFKVLTAVVFGALAVGENSTFAPDYAEAKASASRMFRLFDRVPTIDAYSDEGIKPDHCKGLITLKSVHFTYPTRPDVPVLRGCDIAVNPGQTLALVGQSGCGKSTSVQLLERFYDPLKGEVTLDGVDIRKLNIAWLRQQMGLVSQEPVLFDQSIIENIRYGDCTRVASEAEVHEAAKNANIHDFISSLPDNYSTNVGAKGGQLSGGQKQRVAISRALLRNPKILLLDEATSALDTESERIVQDALDAAREGRTSIIIAHRLSTVRNADQIAVIDNGLVAEVGTHEELVARRGAYFSLVNAQLSDKDRE